MKRIVVLAIALATPLVGCGGNATTVTQAPKALTSASVTTDGAVVKPQVTHGDFVEKLNAYCSEGNSKVDALQARYAAAADKNDYEAAASALVPVLVFYKASVERLNAIEATAGDAQTFGRYKSSVNRQVGAVQRIRSALLAHDDDKILSLTDILTTASKRRVEAAIDLGADKCGQ